MSFLTGSFIKQAHFFLIASILLSFFHSMASPVQAQTQEWGAINAECVINDVATVQGVMCMLANIVSVSLPLLGIAGFVMFVFGAITLLLSGGNSQSVESAKKTMTWAFAGLILALSSILIIRTVADFTGINMINRFLIPSSNTGVNNMNEWNDLD
ncbi:MAG TPA: hypothetical protein PLM16_00590 [Candidatus Woesebacteria bacterium]|nr:hypothetical protein [Candidatus Woesebacteria bacterium]